MRSSEVAPICTTLMADRRVDLLDEGVDLAFRLGPLDDSSFVSRRLASAQQYVVASPACINQRCAPRVPIDLQGHDIILARAPGTDIWHLRHAQSGKTSIKLNARIVATSTEGVLAALAAGLGIAAASAFACRAELERGDLVRLLHHYSLPAIDVHAAMPAGRRSPAKARAFTDYLARALAV